MYWYWILILAASVVALSLLTAVILWLISGRGRYDG
jgi:hypothetical protein